jgi:3',5'-cyclic AMP phosphodiesterase CpdA
VYSILHISDLHRSPEDPISNAELVSALVSDRRRYENEPTRIKAPDAIVVSGDIIQGVKMDAADADVALAAQYATALEFLVELADRFVDGDR